MAVVVFELNREVKRIIGAWFWIKWMFPRHWSAYEKFQSKTCVGDVRTWLGNLASSFFFVCVASLVLLGLGLKYQDNETGLIHVGFCICGIVIYGGQGGQ